MNIYKIYVQHFSQKDSHTSTQTFLLANSSEEVYNWVEGSFGMHCQDEDDEAYLLCKQKMIEIGGEIFDEDYEPCDLYYGHTIYGWEKMESKDLDTEVEVLKVLDMLQEV